MKIRYLQLGVISIALILGLSFLAAGQVNAELIINVPTTGCNTNLAINNAIGQSFKVDNTIDLEAIEIWIKPNLYYATEYRVDVYSGTGTSGEILETSSTVQMGGLDLHYQYSGCPNDPIVQNNSSPGWYNFDFSGTIILEANQAYTLKLVRVSCVSGAFAQCSDVYPDGIEYWLGSNGDSGHDIAFRVYGTVLSLDTDGDGVLDSEDNCPNVSNPNQEDYDGDGFGDACDSDDDNDSVLDAADNCPFDSNSDQVDNDLDGLGDVCDPDDDNDGVNDDVDNCPFNTNADQSDIDGDGLGDICDEDPDNDGIIVSDNCPYDPNPLQEDIDGDGIGDACDLDDDNDGIGDVDDNCPLDSNANQADLDGDAIGDACDSDIDDDGVPNDADNCPLVVNSGQDDSDADGQGDACDDDDDNDGVFDPADNCPLVFNPDQSDEDADGQGDACDGDLDGDGVANEVDNCPENANSAQSDWDGDGLGDVCDEDIDGDNVLNDAPDICEFTTIGAIVDPNTGCSIDQLCPCDGRQGTTTPWKNHGQYVSCVAKSSESFVEIGLITEEMKDEIVSGAANSLCGVKK